MSIEGVPSRMSPEALSQDKLRSAAARLARQTEAGPLQTAYYQYANGALRADTERTLAETGIPFSTFGSWILKAARDDA